jgi:protein tyrosine/serine phosphatase
VALLCGGFEVVVLCVRQKLFGFRLPNYHVVEEELHRGGRPSQDGIKELARKGVKTIINLRVGEFNQKAIKEYYTDQLRLIHLPFFPYEPCDQLMIKFLKIICNKKHTPAYVHCFHGADRTGTVVAIYRIIVQGWDKEDAILEMKSKGLHWWHNNMIEYIRGMDIDYIRRETGLCTPQ